MIQEILQNFGLSDKEISVYLAALRLGPSSVRKISQEANVNRGTTYDVLKSLQGLDLVSYYHQSTHQYFFAEDPKRLISILKERRKKLKQLERGMKEVLPELKSLYNKNGTKPVARYYEGYGGIKKVLKHVLDVVERTEEKTYYVYSSSVRDYMYKECKSFNTDRISRGIKTKVISIGAGGEFAGLDERKWLTQNRSKENPSYLLIYDGYVAMISLNKENIPVSVTIEDRSTYNTQKIIFEFIWNFLR